MRPTRIKPPKRHVAHRLHKPVAHKPVARPPRPKQAELPSNLERIFGKHSVRAVFLTRPRTVRRLIIAGDESYHADFIEMAGDPCGARGIPL